MSEIIKEIIEDPNPIVEVREIMNGALVIKRTPTNPVTLTETHNIKELQEKITKYQNVIAAWQAKIDPLQAIIDEYNAIYEEVV